MRDRLLTDRSDVGIAEQLMIENLTAWRIIIAAGIGIVTNYALATSYMYAGLSSEQAKIAVFVTLNLALFIACIRYWQRGVFPAAPQGWRRGTPARIALAAFIVHFSMLAFASIKIQLFVAFAVAWYKANFGSNNRRNRRIL